MSYPLQGAVYFWPNVSPNHPMGTKRRRWVVVSRDSFNQDSDHVLACPLTSYPPGPADIGVDVTPHNQLDNDSTIRVAMISPIKKAELLEPITRLGKKYTKPVIDRLRMLVEVL